MLTRVTPEAAISSATSGVIRVPLLAREVRRPRDTACRMIWKISGLSRGSPPLRMSMGCRGAILSMKASASFVFNSSGSGAGVAQARQ
jgi:hypothetical protein